MKKVSLFAAICFCLWFIADLISVIGYTVTYVESNGIERLLSSLNVIYFVHHQFFQSIEILNPEIRTYSFEQT